MSLFIYFKKSLFLIGALFLSFIADGQLIRFSYTEQKMGSPFNIIFMAPDTLTANHQAVLCFKLVDSLNQIFSNYDTSSELSKINNSAGGSTMKTSPLMWDLLMESRQAYLKSNGAFNIGVGALTHLWRTARTTKQFPTSTQIKKQFAVSRFNNIILDTQMHTIHLSKKEMQLDFGGIAKGYIAQKVVDFLKSQGISRSLVDAGGDIVLGDAPINKKGWVVGINLPEQAEQLLPHTLQLHNISVATSGDVYQYLEHKGKKYSHIINPATGMGVTSLRNVTVIANNGALADWLATACSILPIEHAKKLALSLGAELLITENFKNHLRHYATNGFDRYWFSENQP